MTDTEPDDAEEFDSLLEISNDNESVESTPVLEEYQNQIDPKLIDAGWGFEIAKSVEHGKTDQSLVNHVRCGVFALERLNEVISRFDGYTLSEDDLRAAIALFVIHDVHKLNTDRDTDPESRFDIPIEEVEEFTEQFGLMEFADSLSVRDFHSCAVDHHNDWTSNHDQTTIRFDNLRPFVRVADSFASCETPEEATSERTQRALDAAYPGTDLELCRHVLDDVKGVLTNLVNAATANALKPYRYEKLLVYQDGVVYLAPEEEPKPDLDKSFINSIFKELKDGVENSHPAYSNPRQLVGNLTTRSQGFYGINDQDFFYSSPQRVLKALAYKAANDADPSSDPTDSMESTMGELEEYLPFNIERTREPVGFARLAYSIKRTYVDPVLDDLDSDRSSLETTCELFDVPEDVQEGLATAAADDELDLTAGGKWDYAYGIGQAIINDRETDGAVLASRVASGLESLDENWVAIVEAERAGNIQTEIDTYIRSIISVDGHPLPSTDETLTDPFEEYHNTRRGKTCVLCNRGTTSGRKSDLKAPKSLTTLQAGYSNHIPVDAGKPDELLACIPCQIELSLRETGSSRREDGRLFVHLVPDYFYTPLSWQMYSQFTEHFSGESRTELDGLAEAVLALDKDSEPLGSYTSALFDENHGRSMIETLDQNFDPTKQFGTKTLGYYKPKDNDTEFQFFGVFVALTVGAVTGLRVSVSESPIPDVRSRDFDTYARIGGGFSQVHDFYGSDISLSVFQSRLNAAAALVRLGYGTEREDTLFAKYLRVTRNKLLPGSHLLKRIAQADDSRNEQYLLEEAQILDEETGLTTDS